MAYLEFPKIVYRNGDVSKESRRVADAAQEAAAAVEGFLALPANPPAEPGEPGSAGFLEFPKILYRDGQIDGDTKRVENGDEQDAAAAEGFLPLGTVIDGDHADEADGAFSDDAHDADEKPRRGGRKKK